METDPDSTVFLPCRAAIVDIVRMVGGIATPGSSSRSTVFATTATPKSLADCSVARRWPGRTEDDHPVALCDRAEPFHIRVALERWR